MRLSNRLDLSTSGTTLALAWISCDLDAGDSRQPRPMDGLDVCIVVHARRFFLRYLPGIEGSWLGVNGSETNAHV